MTPIDPKTPQEKADSKLREYNNWVLKWLTIHEALPGHYVQAEHANEIQPLTRRLALVRQQQTVELSPPRIDPG